MRSKYIKKQYKKQTLMDELLTEEGYQEFIKEIEDALTQSDIVISEIKIKEQNGNK